jgi:large subunit ribosomal protein L6
MSRIGNKHIEIDKDVQISINDCNVTVTGPKGSLELVVDKNISIEFENNIIQLKVINDKDRQGNAKLGLYRSLLQNNVIGVTKGFKKDLLLQGIGYRVQKKGNDLVFSLGYSHPVNFSTPKGIDLNIEGQTKLFVEGIDKELVGRTCANIISLRKRDVYKGKGIYFVGEHIKKKPGKSIKK